MIFHEIIKACNVSGHTWTDEHETEMATPISTRKYNFFSYNHNQVERLLFSSGESPALGWCYKIEKTCKSTFFEMTIT